MVPEFFHRIMGVAASTNVKEIKIDQTDNKWDRLQTPKDKKRGFSISKRWVSSADTENSSNRRQKQLSSSLEAAEKRAIDAEQRVRQLEREVGTLELRNMELAEEVTWLKKQLSDRPEVPILPRPATGSNRTIETTTSDDYKKKSLQNIQILEEQIKRYEDDILKLKTKFSKDNQRIQAEMEDQKHTFDREMRSVDNHLVRANKLNEVYEDFIRQTLSSEALEDIKSRAVSERYSLPTSSSSFVTANDLASNGGKNRAQLILELTEQIADQKDKIRNLENDIVKRDIEIVHMKDMMTTSEAALQASLSAANFKKLSNESRRPAFSALRRNSAASSSDNAKPMKVERSLNDDVHDEIVALLKPQIGANLDDDDDDDDRRRSFPALSQSTGALMLREKFNDNNVDNDDDSDERLKKGHKRTISAPKKVTVHADSPLKNVYSLTEDLEPIKVKDTPSSSSMSMRPKTAIPNPGGARPKANTIKQNSILELEELEDEPTKSESASSARFRTHSAPMIFKPRPTSRGNNKGRNRPEPEGYASEKVVKRSDSTDVMSLNDVDIGKTDLNQMATFKEEFEGTVDQPQMSTSSSVRKPPLPVTSKNSKSRNPGSAASVYSSSAMGSGEDNETSDEEIRRLLEKHSAKPSRRPAVGGSAKSRDSGFLGESYTSAQSSNMWRNDENGVGTSKKSDNDD